MKEAKWLIIVWIAGIFFIWGCAPPKKGPVPETAPKQAEISQKDTRPNSVAVWNLEYRGAENKPESRWGEILSQIIMASIDEDDRYQVVEREKLLLALEELNLGTSDIADPETRLRLGNIVGARLMVFGSYLILANKMRLDIRLVDVETGRILKAVAKNIKSPTLPLAIKITKNAANELIE